MQTILELNKYPLKIHSPGDKHGEYFNLHGPYLLSLEECNMSKEELSLTMFAPGYYESNTWSLHNVYSPEMRPLHRHDSIELVYIIRGTMTHYIEDFQRTYTKGDCIIMDKNVQHVESFSSDYKAIFLMISDKFILDALTNDVYFDSDFNMHTKKNLFFEELIDLLQNDAPYKKTYWDLIPNPDKTEMPSIIHDLLGQMIYETNEQSAGFYSIVTGTLTRLLTLFSDPESYKLRKMPLSDSNEDYIFNRITIYLEKNNGHIDYEELETLMHYTRDYLNRIIKRRTSMTLTEYAQKICLEKAADLLTTTNKSISQIIHELNYTNRTYFYRIFSNKYGVTPTEYRLRTQDKNSK